MKISKIRILSVILITLMCSAISYFYLVSHNAFGKIYQEETRNTIIEIKKTFLKDTINNLFVEIDVERELEYDRYKYFTKQRGISLDFASEDDDEFIKFFTNRFDTDIKNLGKDNYWTILFWDNITNEVIYNPQSEYKNGDDLDFVIERLKSELLSYEEVKHGRVSGIFGVKTKFVDDKIKLITAEKIRRQRFDDGSYIWVSQILNYNGGDNYAIRIVHPNLPETEGSFLSTSTMNTRGNKPYLEELDGINKNGELFFSYYFKKLNSDEIAEKLSYSRLYKDFDWVISTGVYIDEVDAYVENTNIKSKSLAREIVLQLMLVILIVMSAGIALVVHTEGIYSKKMNKRLKNEADYDALTNAYSRRRGVEELANAYSSFVKGSQNPTLMMFDLDRFKLINDNFGHDIGDVVLRRTVEAINEIIKDTDIIIRWGGDEFIGVFYGLKKEEAIEIAQRILDKINSIEIPVKTSEIDDIVKIEMSIGVTYFSKSDRQASDAVKRADDAMYESKETGRNKVSYFDVEDLNE